LKGDIAWTLPLLGQCLLAGVQKLVYVSSGGTVYGLPAVTPIPETHPTEPISLHGAGKLAVEKYLAVFRRHGLHSAVARPANVYGPHQDPRARLGFITTAMACAWAGEQITVWGDGSVVRDCIYVDDLCDALLRLGAGHTHEHAYNIGTGTGVSVNDLIATIRAVTSHTLRVCYTAGRIFDVPTNVLATGRLTSETGWVPRVSLREGMERTWDWIRDTMPTGHEVRRRPPPAGVAARPGGRSAPL
jgi:UDP-glucose 4-epimerase